MTDFDPAAHRMVPQQRWFEDFSLGERFIIPSRTMTGAVIWQPSRLRAAIHTRSITTLNIAERAECRTCSPMASRP